MLKFVLMTDKDRREAAAIEKKRAFEEERKKRIFNPKFRAIGVDKEALDKQLEEKKKQKEEEKKLELSFANQLKSYDEVALAMEKKEKKEKQKMIEEITEFRKNFQKFEDRREYDLNDPHFLRNSLPARIHDSDPRLGASSVQKFEGEDVTSAERIKIMKEQLQTWLRQQMLEREAAEKERKTAEEAYLQALVARDKRAVQLDCLEKECRRKLQEATARFNKALAEERECEEREKKRQELEDNLAEIYNTMTSDMMSESKDSDQSNLGASRRIGFMFRGEKHEVARQIREEQLAQIEENKKMKEEKKKFDEEWDRYTIEMQRKIALLDREEKKKLRDQNKQVAEENKSMSVEHKHNQDFLEKIVYTNKPTAAFYEQFNKSTR